MKVIHQYIKNARIPISQISKKTGVSEKELNTIQQQETLPAYAVLRKLSKFFKIPISALLKEAEIHQEYEFLYRKSLDENLNFISLSKFQKFIANIREIKADVSHVIPIREVLKSAEDSLESAEVLARDFRLIFFSEDFYSPISQLPELLSNKLGFIVKVIEAGNKADGASALIDGWIFLFVSPRFEGRMLFTLAHELGHVLNHHHSENYFYYDKRITGNLRSTKGQQERFANAFASALLLPPQGVALTINKIRQIYQIPEDSPIGDIEILYLARFYGVSFDVAANRLEQLGLIPEGGSFSMSEKIKKEYGSPEKRANSLGLPARQIPNFEILPPFVVKKSIKLVEEGKYSIERMASLLSIPIAGLIKYRAELGRN
ncbi:ImmA/IrrE family metallo-endopeptidase [Gelidibacter japonicus]|uniref:ImmA/IrrE family metallo-endopeptidase n=1 Tax=Gelidibacter japonicus TaxID=1962232 RepID=UPI003A93973B